MFPSAFPAHALVRGLAHEEATQTEFEHVVFPSVFAWHSFPPDVQTYIGVEQVPEAHLVLPFKLPVHAPTAGSAQDVATHLLD